MGSQSSFFPDRKEVGLEKRTSRPTRDLNKSTLKAGTWFDSFEKTKSQSSSTSFDCSTCKLDKSCRNPYITRMGEAKKRILIVGSHPKKKEDELGVPLASNEYFMLKEKLEFLGINLNEDCAITNVIRCGKETEPTGEQVKACLSKLEKDISEVQPELIICLGSTALNAVLKKPKGCNFKGGFSDHMLHGLVIPDKYHNCWTASSYSPEYFLSRKKDKKVPDDENILLFDLAAAISYIGKKLPLALPEEGHYLAGTVSEAIDSIEKAVQSGLPISYDYEATRLTPWEKGAEIVSIAFATEIGKSVFIPLNFPNPVTRKPFFTDSEVEEILKHWKNLLISANDKVIQNLNLEECWNREYLKVRMRGKIFDTMLAFHVLNCRKSTTSLAFQAFYMTGHDYKSTVNTKDIKVSRLEDLFHYNCWDSDYTLMSYYQQKLRFSSNEILNQFFEFVMKGSIVLVGLTCRGVPINFEELTELEREYNKLKDNLVQTMRNLRGVHQYEETNKVIFNPDSPAQLAAILIKGYHITPDRYPGKLKGTTTGKLCTDKNALPIIMEVCEDMEVKKLLCSLLEFRKCCSLLERVENYRKNLDQNSRVHPSYLILCDTYRSSSEEPNIQNVFKHDEDLKIFRRAIVPSKGRILTEVDYSGVEVKVIAMASGDPVLIEQINTGFDPHAYWGAKLFQKPENEVSKLERFESKNGFVFKSFYGGTPDAMPFYSDLFRTIPKQHFFDVQKEFWDMYKGVREWQNSMIEFYKNNGYLQAMSGFQRPGTLNINKLYNTPIQGPGFHLLLNGLIILDFDEFNSGLIQNGFKSVPLFEIHDSITFDTVPTEAFELHNYVTKVLTDKYFEWQRNLPMQVEWEIGIKNWFELKSLTFRRCSICEQDNVPHSKESVKNGDKKEQHLICAFCGKKEII